MSNAKEVLETAVDAWNRKDTDGFVALAAPDAKVTATGGLELYGEDGFRQFYLLWLTGFPDNIIRYRNIVAEGDRVIGEGTFSGTHTGPLRQPAGEIPPTGRRLSADFVAAFRMADGKVASLRLYFDTMDLVQQLGLATQPAVA